jgi:hypothetical protein
MYIFYIRPKQKQISSPPVLVTSCTVLQYVTLHHFLLEAFDVRLGPPARVKIVVSHLAYLRSSRKKA